MQLLADNTYQKFSALSFSTVVKISLTSIPKSLDMLQERTTYRDELDKIIQNLEQVKKSVYAYAAARPKMSGSRKFAHFLNFTALKVWILKKSVPKLINKMTVAKTLEEKAIAEKLDLVKRVYQRFQTNPQQADTAQNIDAYFQYKIKELKEGKNPALPDYYHATKDKYFNSIVKSHKLKQYFAPMGRGAYVSTNIENSYGPYAFALEAKAVHSYRAKYFIGFCTKKPEENYASTWIRVAHSITLKFRTVAHITTESAAECATMNARLKTLNFDVPVITRTASICIANLFSDEGAVRKFPTKWSRLHRYETFPPNIIESARAA